jgi:hypothetical protein
LGRAASCGLSGAEVAIRTGDEERVKRGRRRTKETGRSKRGEKTHTHTHTHCHILSHTLSIAYTIIHTHTQQKHYLSQSASALSSLPPPPFSSSMACPRGTAILSLALSLVCLLVTRALTAPLDGEEETLADHYHEEENNGQPPPPFLSPQTYAIKGSTRERRIETAEPPSPLRIRSFVISAEAEEIGERLKRLAEESHRRIAHLLAGECEWERERWWSFLLLFGLEYTGARVTGQTCSATPRLTILPLYPK